MRFIFTLFLCSFSFQLLASTQNISKKQHQTVTVSENFLVVEKNKDVIYGEDNRLDVFESFDRLLVRLSRSTAAMIESSSLENGGKGQISIKGKTLQQVGVCEKERFSHQPAAAHCSGFLIAPRILVTAGHCIKDQSDCRKFKWVFDYHANSSEQNDFSVSQKSIFSCEKILKRELNATNKNDYAVIKLDRKVRDRSPLKFRKSGTIEVGTSLAVIGHPSGLPTKIADGAKVRSLKDKYFVANLDTYGGNSGSAVFNADTGLVEGILVRGERDYVRDPILGCMVSHVCGENSCRGEDVTYISNIDF